MQFRKGFFIGLIVVVAFVGGFVLLFKNGSRTVETAGLQRHATTSQPQNNQKTPAPTPAWKTYTNSTFGFSLQYPSTWTVHPNKEYIGFKSPEWVKDGIDGDTVTIGTYKNVPKDKVIQDSGFQTIAQARANNDLPEGGEKSLAEVEYLTVGSAAGPAEPAKSTTINGQSAIVADTQTRLYGGKTHAYTGLGDGKNILIFGNNGMAANIWVVGRGDEFDHMLSSFKFTASK